MDPSLSFVRCDLAQTLCLPLSLDILWYLLLGGSLIVMIIIIHFVSTCTWLLLRCALVNGSVLLSLSERNLIYHIILVISLLFLDWLLDSEDGIELCVLTLQLDSRQLIIFQIAMILLIQIETAKINKAMVGVERNSRQLHYHWLPFLYSKAATLDKHFVVSSSKTFDYISKFPCATG